MVDTEAELKTTAFQPIIERLGAEMTAWTGYSSPNRFSDPLDEYWAVRQRVGVYDLSPLRKFEFKGPDALALAQKLVTRDLSRMKDGQVHYTPMCDEDGGIVDDCTVFRFGPEHAWLISGNEADAEWILGVAAGPPLAGRTVQVANVTDRLPNLAVQGPQSRDVLRTLVGPVIDGLKYYWFTRATIKDVPVVLSRTGYTGEIGYEIFLAPDHDAQARAETIWNAVMEAGRSADILPCGLLSLDMVRVEYGLLFYGYDMDRSNNPFEVGLDGLVSLDGPDFIGKEALRAIRARGVHRKLVGLEVEAPEAVGGGTVLDQDGNEVGVITSPNYSPLLKKSIALAFVKTPLATLGQRVTVDDSCTHYTATVARTPFYDPDKKRVRS
jgi:aminomethyltransferase